MTGINIEPSEMTKLANLWEFHRRECVDPRDIKITYASGSGIGTRVLGICGCGKELDATDYTSW